MKKEEKKHKEEEKKAKKEMKEEEKKAKKERKRKEKEEEEKKKGEEKKKEEEKKKQTTTAPVVSPLSPRSGPKPPTGEIWVYEKKNFDGKVRALRFQLHTNPQHAIQMWKLKGNCANFQVVHSAPLYVGSLRLGTDTVADVHNNPGHHGQTKKFEHDVGTWVLFRERWEGCFSLTLYSELEGGL
jgi:hypothetical protein